MSDKQGFTLIELLVVIAIIGLLSVLAVITLDNGRRKARDARRLADMKQIQTALDLYYENNGRFPDRDHSDCSGWDSGSKDFPFLEGRLNGIMDDPPEDPYFSGCDGYRYYRYTAGSDGCDPAKGAFYVLGVRNMETSSRPHP